MKTEFLFYKPLKANARTGAIFDIINIYFQSHNIESKKLFFCPTDGAPAMMRKKTRVIILANNMAPDMIGNHCLLTDKCYHRRQCQRNRQQSPIK